VTPFALPRGRGGAGRGAPGLRLYGVVSLAAPGRLAVDGAAASAGARLHTPPLGTPAAELVRARDLGAVVADARFAAEPLTAELVAAHRAVVEAVFADRAVLPAPPGALFRSRAALVAWMELHAGSLAEGLRFVEDRAEARVTAEAAPPADGDAAARAAEAFAALRREAAALLVLRGGPGASAADGGSGVAGPGGPYGQEGPIVPAAPGGAQAGGPPAGGPPAAPALPPAPVGARPPGDAQAAFLVDRGRWRVFAEAVAREGRRHPGLRLACAGPWPPYSFVRLDFNG
jgi:hypothetical protein